MVLGRTHAVCLRLALLRATGKGDRDMSQGEFVVIQVLTAYDMPAGEVNTTGFYDRWLDYSRCTARQAQTFLSDKAGSGKWRAKHWCGGEQLYASQLARMASDELGSFAEYAPGGEDDFWNVTIELDSAEGTFVLRTSVDAWSGKPWDRLVNKISEKVKGEGWTVKSVRLAE